MFSAGNRSRQIAAVTSLVALLACLAISIKRNSMDSGVDKREELVVLAPMLLLSMK